MIIHGKNLFPLTLTLVGAQGYFMDADGEIWSERAKKGSLLKLTGTRSSSGRYITLQTNARFGQTYRYDQLQREAGRHKDWAKHTITLEATMNLTKTDLASALGLKGAQPLTGNQLRKIKTIDTFENRAHAATVADGIYAKGWVISGINDEGQMSFGARPVIHTTEASVNEEIKRLASTNPGKKFVKLRIEGALTVGASVWE